MTKQNDLDYADAHFAREIEQELVNLDLESDISSVWVAALAAISGLLIRNIGQIEVTSSTLGRRLRASKLAIAAIRKLLRRAEETSVRMLERAMADTVRSDRKWLAGVLLAVYGISIKTKVGGATVSAEPVFGITIDDRYRRLAESVMRRVGPAITRGVVDGLPTAEIEKAVRVASKPRLTVHGAAVNATSAMTHATARSRERVAKEKDWRVMWSSVLDEVTTEICISRHGRTWPAGEGPRPPAHENCRSRAVPVPPGSKPSMGVDDFEDWLHNRATPRQRQRLTNRTKRRFRVK